MDYARIGRRRGVIALFALAVCLAGWTGCGSQDGTTPTASIGEPTESAPATKPAPMRPQYNEYPVVQVSTSAGNFTIKLNSKLAPLTVHNFLTHVHSGHYNGTVFHQAFDGFILLGGGYDADLKPRPTDAMLRNEAHNKLSNQRGTIAMARPADAIDGAKSEFFINLADNTSLDHVGWEPEEYGYCVFGEIASGMEVVDAISKGPVHSTGGLENVPVDLVVIESIERIK